MARDIYILSTKFLHSFFRVLGNLNLLKMDPYKILDVPKNFSLNQLKDNYKRIALKVHPDKGGTEQLFQLVTKAYKMLVEEYNRRVAERDFNELKHEFRQTLKSQSARPTTRYQDNEPRANSKFDINKFNQVFQENRIDTVTDKGYHDWMSTTDAPAPKQLKNFNDKAFHRQFDKQAAIDKNNKYIIPYKEPEPLLMSKKIGFTELGQDDIDDFSGENTSKKNLNYMDYKVAHTTTRIVDPTLAKNIRQYKNIDELEKDRSSVRYEMNEEEMEDYVLQKKLEKIREQKRLEAMRQQEDAIANHYERVNRLMIGMRR